VPAAYSEQVLDETNMTSGLINSSWQVNNANRVHGLLRPPVLQEAQRFLASSALYTSESNSNEDDIFNIVQGLWNSVLTSQAVHGRARQLQQDLWFPLYYNGSDHGLTDPVDAASLLRNELSEQLYDRKRLQARAPRSTTTSTRRSAGGTSSGSGSTRR